MRHYSAPRWYCTGAFLIKVRQSSLQRSGIRPAFRPLNRSLPKPHVSGSSFRMESANAKLERKWPNFLAEARTFTRAERFRAALIGWIGYITILIVGRTMRWQS